MDIVDLLLSELKSRKAKNSQYSLRAYARSLKIQPASLSSILRRKRAVPQAEIPRLVAELKLSKKQQQLILKKSKKSLIDPTTIEYWHRPVLANSITTKDIIEDWEYGAVMSLCKTPGFCEDANWLAQRLGIKKEKAHKVLSDLIAAKMLVKKTNGSFIPHWDKLRTIDDISSEVLIKAHEKELQLASQKLHEVELHQRDFSSLTFTLNPKRLTQLKKLIRSFLVQVEKDFERGETTEVYCLATQLFPLTELKNKT